MEGAGVVEAVGSAVKDVKPGDRVAFAMQLGAYAQKIVAPAWKLVGVPASLPAPTAAALMLQGMTAHYLVTDTFSLGSGDCALVHAAAGGVGLLLVQMAKMRGARILATVSTEEKARLARQAGADEVVLYEKEDFGEAARRFTEGRGMQVVYDSVGRTTFEKSLASLAPRGMLVLYGQSSGPVPPIDPLTLSAGGSLFLTRPSLAHYSRDREELLQRAGDVLYWTERGQLWVRIDRTIPMESAGEAHRLLESRLTAGKLLLVP
jgi:NADPH2:quinone reductase